jgi:RimJ/RimL family protein N-acetyltransferase
MTTVSLEPLDERWRDDIASLIDDPDVLRFTRVPEPPPAGFAEAWIERYVAGRRSGTCDGFAALSPDGEFLGMAVVPHIDRAAAEVELGYIVAAAARGRGVATEILCLLTAWAFDELGAERVVLIIDVENHASARVAERCGYQLEGVMRSIHVKPGRRADAGLWSRLRSDPSLPARDGAVPLSRGA